MSDVALCALVASGDGPTDVLCICPEDCAVLTKSIISKNIILE